MTTLNAFPSSEETCEFTKKFVKRHPEMAWTEVIGVSEEGRDVMAIHLTDRTSPSEEKEVFLAAYGRHGNELGTRAAGIGLLEWLGSEEASEIRRHQHIITIPVVNPDGGVRDKFHAPEDKLSRLEKDVIAYLAETYRPDAVIDVHSLWYNDLQAVIDGHSTSWGEDNMIHRKLAMGMAEAAEKIGYPFIVTDPENIERTLEALTYNNFFCEAFYEEIHALVFGLELNHFNTSPSDVKNSGVACVLALLKEGTQRFPWGKNPGYPNEILVGDLFTSIRARGENAGERRKSRVEAWKNRKQFQGPKRNVMKNGNIKVEIGYSGKKLSTGVEITTRIRKDRSIQGLFLNGEDVNEFSTFQDTSSTYVAVPVNTVKKGEYELNITTGGSMLD
jgi:hypothetical protein